MVERALLKLMELRDAYARIARDSTSVLSEQEMALREEFAIGAATGSDDVAIEMWNKQQEIKRLGGVREAILMKNQPMAMYNEQQRLILKTREDLAFKEKELAGITDSDTLYREQTQSQIDALREGLRLQETNLAAIVAQLNENGIALPKDTFY